MLVAFLALAVAEKTCGPGCTAGVGLLQKSPRQHVMVAPWPETPQSTIEIEL